jgi:hypothetical protein
MTGAPFSGLAGLCLRRDARPGGIIDPVHGRLTSKLTGGVANSWITLVESEALERD